MEVDLCRLILGFNEKLFQRAKQPRREFSTGLGTMNRYSRWLVYVIFFLSGAAALVYEISWSRQLGLLFGHTVHAASVVLGSYFAGMALGYSVGGYLTARVRPLMGYAVAELVVAVWAFAIPSILQWSESPGVAGWLTHESFIWQIALRASFSFVLLLPATIALGVTLPMMTAWLAAGRSMADPEKASLVSQAYAVNTAGALLGVTVATFWMLVNCGVCGSSYVAAAVSVVCAVAALAVGRLAITIDNFENQSDVKSSGHLAGPDDSNEVSLMLGRLRLAAVVTGFSTLALQVLYTRMFSLVFHNSTYTFGIVVAVFLAALSLGAACASRINSVIDQKTIPRCAGWALAGAAIYVVVSIPLFVALTNLDYFRFGEGFTQYMFGATGLVLIVVGPGVFLAGAVLPLIWRVAGEFDDDAGRVVGQLTSANTIAAAAGAMVASFMVLPLVGLWTGFVFVAGLVLAIAVMFLSIELVMARWLWVVCVWSILAAVTMFSPTESGAAHRDGEETIARWHSAYGWIDLVKSGTSRSARSVGRRAEVYKIRQNLHYRFGKTGSNAREYRQAHLPLLMHDSPRDVLFLGLGTGLTAGGAIVHQEVQSVTAVELIPEVVEAARELAAYNFNVVDHAKSHVVCDDGRHFLLATDENFDVIVSDLFVPWESESGYLYTVEHYEVAATRLKEGGLFCQWLPLYQVGEAEFESIASSFAKVFPSVTLWWGKLAGSRGPVIALVGKFDQVHIDSKAVDMRIAKLGDLIEVDPSMANTGLLVDHFIGRWEVANASESVLLNRDEYPVVEFSTPVSNRDRKLISGAVFEDYYQKVLCRLSMEHLSVDGKTVSNPEQLKKRQSLLLFGGR